MGSAPTWTTHHPREDKLIEGFIAELGRAPDNLKEKIAIYFLRTMIWKAQFALKGKRLGEKHVRLTKEALSRNGLDISVSSDLIAP